MNRTYFRGDMYFADLGKGIGSEQEGYRPVVIIQNNIGNKYSPTVIVASISGKIATKAKLPTHYYLDAENGLGHPSVILLEQIRTIDKHRLENYIGRIDEKHLTGLNLALAISIDITDWMRNTLVLCLCPVCAKKLADSGTCFLQQINPHQKEKGICIYCSIHAGCDYAVTKKQP